MDESGIYLDSNQPRLMVHPSVLAIAEHVSCSLAPRRLKTWLGLRYDRPAIPQAYVAVTEILVKKIKAKRSRKTAARVRDVLASFNTGDDGQVEFELIAILPSPSSEEVLRDVQDWISGIALEVPPEVGIGTRVEARPDEEVSLAFIEKSFVLDASSLTWPISPPGLSGEFRP